jgi:hypothetical protein
MNTAQKRENKIHRTETAQQNTPHKDGIINNTKPNKYVKNHTYLITRKKKQFGGVILGQDLT